MSTKKISKHADGGLNRLFLTMTIFPLIFLGAFIIVAGYFMYMNGLQAEVRKGLKAVAESVLISYDEKYSGDYNLVINETTGEIFLQKGDTRISEDTGIIDQIKEKTGIDITIFFYDTRLMTTIVDENGNSVAQTVVNPEIADQVLLQHQEAFYSNASIGGTEYFAEYIPIFSETGTCTGMIATAKSSHEVYRMINNSVLSNIVLVILAIFIVALFIRRFSKKIVAVIVKIMRFLGEIADGNLNSQLEETIVSRADELGEMGRFTVYVQASLKKLIEKDALTGIYNRRSGQNRSAAILERSSKFCVAMGDIDFFKKVNDTYGHDAGDEVLKTVARILSDHLVGNGFVCRWGGEEFLMIFDGKDIDASVEILNNALDTIRQTVVNCNEYNISVTMSYGVVTGNLDEDIETQIKKADNGLYYAKSHGRNQVVNVDMLTEADYEENNK